MRIEIPGGRYHVTARGNERRSIFRKDGDREHFLTLLSDLRSRFGVRVHAYVLMDNHYHLVVQTPEANLSRACQWLNVSYSVWFNRRHRRSGHLFQGRFKAVVLEEDAGLQRVSRYVHLNPVRLLRFGLGKRQRQASSQGIGQAVGAELQRQRLHALRDYPWSSYPAVAGYRRAPEWLSLRPLRELCGGRNQKEQVQALRRYTEEPIREGLSENPWEGLVGGLVLGSVDYAQELLKGLKGNRREQPDWNKAGKAGVGASWEEIVKSVERAKGQRWNRFCEQKGDWGRDAALWLGRRAGRMRLADLADRIGGCDYTTVGKALTRFENRLAGDRKLRERLEALQNEMSCFEI